MARDRLAALRAQKQQQQGGAPQQSHELANLQAPDRFTPEMSGVFNGGTDAMAEFYNEITAVQELIQQLNGNVQRITDIQQRSLSNPDDGSRQHTSALLDDLSIQTRDLGNTIKTRIQALETQPVRPGEDIRMRKNRISVARSKFVEALQHYQEVERDHRANYRQRIERQFRIVKPDATQDEVNTVVNNVQGGGDQIFTQALTSSTRYGESRAAYREVQDRHEDIRRIERTLEELAQLFNDLSTLVNEQDDATQAILTTAAQVEADTSAALDQTEKAVRSAWSARRKRWICFFICLIILAVVGIVVGVTVGGKK